MGVGAGVAEAHHHPLGHALQAKGRKGASVASTIMMEPSSRSSAGAPSPGPFVGKLF